MKPGTPTPKPDNKQAFQEVLSELEQTRKDYAKASLQLTQQETFIAHLKDGEAKKDAVIAHLEDELRNAEQIHHQELAVVTEEAKTTQLEAEHRIRFLELEVTRLTEENNIYTNFENENKEMRKTLMYQQEQMEKLTNLNEELRSKARDDMTDFRQQLEEEFKKRLAESEKKFQSEAYRALSEEAKVALQGNDHLQTVLSKQNDSIEAVLGRCKQLETSHSKMRLEQDLSHQSLQLHQAEVQKLRKQLSDSKSRCQQLEDSLKQRRIERASLELLYMEYESTQKELQKATDKLRRTQRAAERWKNRVMAQQHDVAGPGRLRQIQSSTAEMSRGRHAALRLESRETAASMSSDDEGFDSGGWDTGGEEAPHRAKVDPMEILAMWNVNFENWKPQGLPDSLPELKDTQLNDPQADAAAHGPRPPVNRPRKVRQTVERDRLEKDRELSVLSKRKFKSVPPQGAVKQKPHQVPYQPFSIPEGQALYAAPTQKSAPATRFLVP
jgi:myosin heavy subunit|uniref:Cilia- and flagella-associated protein 157 n=1 Tax=Eutreptiella gymnastica TaxID=73025 RepID=A0A7S4LDH9_9EUGL|mmetsp:Transcript_8699/g.13310  ORF Transcript_8699/g.13310 Transcript_8699/m.13310 type:complete len:498 (-) Transcript_8699:1910-3403(-)|eukprot:CAMPEP_0174290648 /NCGR_PEP_ID=MMETSP0809-20121228/29624_1 /TAXON_ID=73025 ORGANISM="Eutreptiella gymnastica-like, Strain CCMP1594" /NCGR_SAMPLE_ID=MMETSP0809 /ASSEMBLY_ACC=CAM_ASM_000658 /LENGTH=497 /DNA_ID=CAMNT_0015389475 /DNA_START=94 /DNA_END=1587 /DNA_ORIENTATION=+